MTNRYSRLDAAMANLRACQIALDRANAEVTAAGLAVAGLSLGERIEADVTGRGDWTLCEIVGVIDRGTYVHPEAREVREDGSLGGSIGYVPMHRLRRASSGNSERRNERTGHDNR